MLDSRKREIRAKAEEFRDNCKIGKYGIIDIFEECSRRRYKLFRYPLGENGDMGFAHKRDQDIIVFTNSSIRLSREIFTLAHEFGHIELHFGNDYSFVDNSQTVFGKTQESIEQEANYFAACLLLPEDVLRKFFDLEFSSVGEKKLSAIDITKIMSEFKVSFEMVLNRLADMGLIDADEKKRLDNEKNLKRVGNLLKATGGDCRLNVASLETALPFEYLDYVIYNFNHGVIPKETLVKALDCYGFSIEDIYDKIIEPSDEELDLDELMGGM